MWYYTLIHKNNQYEFALRKSDSSLYCCTRIGDCFVSAVLSVYCLAAKRIWLWTGLFGKWTWNNNVQVLLYVESLQGNDEAEIMLELFFCGCTGTYYKIILIYNPYERLEKQLCEKCGNVLYLMPHRNLWSVCCFCFHFLNMTFENISDFILFCTCSRWLYQAFHYTGAVVLNCNRNGQRFVLWHHYKSHHQLGVGFEKELWNEPVFKCTR